MEGLMQIVRNLWQVGGGDLSAPEDAAIYLIRSGGQAALIDAGCGNGHEQLVENISSVLKDIVRPRCARPLGSIPFVKP
jgi:glyoxylase-like metal-dependent hydrolase (beta-lactamase superfamily II)